ncbi:MAG: NAD(P)/FAD-dependent oxidoreductase [Gammaproteobacteria bacterium]|nr:NAD(P)/FAD-dependent oxidoreductase [Gammaproteobacteria bacterium]
MLLEQGARVVIVGGGAGGLELATRLGRRYGRRGELEVTLVDRNHSHLWKPLLHEVAAGTLNSSEDELSYLAQAHWNHFNFRLGALHSLDRAARTVTLAPSLDQAGREYMPERTLPWDILVLAIGSVTNDFGTRGVAEHCFFLDAREQADAFHQHLTRACYGANAQDGPIRPGQLHIAIAGAGATGVELAAELHHAVRALVAYGLDRIDVEADVRLHLIEGAERILPGLPESVSSATAKVLDSIGVEVHTGEFITEATADGFHTRSGRFIPAAIKVWAAGIKGAAVLEALDGLETNRLNQLVVGPTLQTTRDARIFALGDCAACPLGDDGRSVPPRAQAAHQQATLLARSIAQLRAGAALPVYAYRDFGSLINLAEHSAIGNLMGNLLSRHPANYPIEGRLARWAYLSLYKLHQVAVQGWVRTLLGTLADLLTRSSKPRLKLH